jgi:hypothetical protein
MIVINKKRRINTINFNNYVLVFLDIFKEYIIHYMDYNDFINLRFLCKSFYDKFKYNDLLYRFSLNNKIININYFFPKNINLVKLDNNNNNISKIFIPNNIINKLNFLNMIENKNQINNITISFLSKKDISMILNSDSKIKKNFEQILIKSGVLVSNISNEKIIFDYIYNLFFSNVEIFEKFKNIKNVKINNFINKDYQMKNNLRIYENDNNNLNKLLNYLPNIRKITFDNCSLIDFNYEILSKNPSLKKIKISYCRDIDCPDLISKLCLNQNLKLDLNNNYDMDNTWIENNFYKIQNEFHIRFDKMCINYCLKKCINSIDCLNNKDYIY